MTSEQIDRVFGRGRLKMVTGAHVEVFREAAAPGESRRYTKRFLTTADGDYAQWTEREWRILARLIGHGTRCVPDVVQYDRGARGTKLVQTYDAGATVDQWATLLPIERDGRVYAHAFEDCAHWWALAHHCLVALDEIHTLQLVHLDVKGDNICIPIGPGELRPRSAGTADVPGVPQARADRFRVLAGVRRDADDAAADRLATGLRLSVAAPAAGARGRARRRSAADRRSRLALRHVQPRRDAASAICRASIACTGPSSPTDGRAERYDAAKSLILRIREAHDRDLSSRRPHAELIAETSAQLGAHELAQSLERGWMLARDAQPFAVPCTAVDTGHAACPADTTRDPGARRHRGGTHWNRRTRAIGASTRSGEAAQQR